MSELVFGPGGLKIVFPLLPSVEAGPWGGRESEGAPQGALGSRSRG